MDASTLDALTSISEGCLEEQGSALFEAQSILAIYNGKEITEPVNCNSSAKISNFVNNEQGYNVTSIKSTALNNYHLSVHPNPNTGTFYLTASTKKSNSQLDVIIRDVAGKLVIRNLVNLNDNNEIKIELESLNTGIYFIECTDSLGEKYHCKVDIIK